MKKRIHNILHELQHHLPFTVLAVICSMILLAVYTELLRSNIDIGGTYIDEHGHEGPINPFTKLFHVLHPIHVLLSAAATSAMFWRYDRRLFVAIATGLSGSLVICGISDMLLPFLGGMTLNMHMHFHMCLLEHPATVLMFSLIGIAIGIYAASGMNTASTSKMTHALHVGVSTGATILYLVGFGLMDWTTHIVPVFIIVTLSVVIPCCTGDIVFPLMLVNQSGVHMCLGHCHNENDSEQKNEKQ